MRCVMGETREREEIIKFVREYRKKNHKSPSNKEISVGLGYALAAVVRHVQTLLIWGVFERKGRDHGIILAEENVQDER